MWIIESQHTCEKKKNIMLTAGAAEMPLGPNKPNNASFEFPDGFSVSDEGPPSLQNITVEVD